MERWKIKAIVTKCQKARGEISLFSEGEKNYKSDTGDETDPDQAGNDEYLLQLQKRVGKRYK